MNLAPSEAAAQQSVQASVQDIERLLQRQQARLEEQERRLVEQEQRFDEQRRAIDEQRRELEALRARLGHPPRVMPAVAAASPPPAPPRPRLAQVPRPPAPIGPESIPPTQIPTPPAQAPTPPAELETRASGEREEPVQQLVLERGGILLPPGTLQLEPGIEYSRITSDRVAINGFSIFEAIVIGTIRVDRLDRDIVTSSLAARYGMFDRVQLEGRVPYIWREDMELLGVGTPNQRERTVSGSDIGDTEVAIAYQPIIGSGWVPNVVVRAEATIPTGRDPFGIRTETIGPGGETRLTDVPTGSGFYGVGPSATLVWRSDPVVFFAGGGYTFNLERSFSGFGDVDPGDAVELFAGFNIALNERVSMNLSVVDQFVQSTEQNGVESVGTSFSDARLVAGASIALTPSTALLFSAGAGLTEQSPDFTFGVRLPITFQLF